MNTPSTILDNASVDATSPDRIQRAKSQTTQLLFRREAAPPSMTQVPPCVTHEAHAQLYAAVLYDTEYKGMTGREWNEQHKEAQI
jgi:hypothetical protein